MKKHRRGCVLGIAAMAALCLVALVASVASNLTTSRESKDAGRLNDQEKARLIELFHLRQSLGDQVWPDWGAAEIPVVVYNEANAFLLAYPEQPPAGWQNASTGKAHGGIWQPVIDDELGGMAIYRLALTDPRTTPQAFTVRIGERWAASMQTSEWFHIAFANQLREDLPAGLGAVLPLRLVTHLFLDGTEKYISLLAHEAFHAFQGTVAPARLTAAESNVGVLESRYPWEDPDHVSDWEYELDLLARALESDTDQQAAELARQFVDWRRERRTNHQLSPQLAEYERQREWLEGLARYVELRIWQAAALTPEYRPAPETGALDDFDAYRGYAGRWRNEVDQLRRMADDHGDGRFYGSGMAQAVLLDRLMPDWKSRALNDGVFLEDLLVEAVE